MSSKHAALAFILGMGMVMVSCVSPRVVQDLRKENETLKQEKKSCETKVEALKLRVTKLQAKYDALFEQYSEQEKVIAKLKNDTTLLHSTNRNLQRLYNELNAAYERLLKVNKDLLSEKARESQELSTDVARLKAQLELKQQQLQAKEKALQDKELSLLQLQTKLEKLEQALKEREEKIVRLERVLHEKDSTVKAIRTQIAQALLKYDGKGMSVKIKKGKVYVTMQEKLLFPSGSYRVNAEGQKALVQLASYLKQNPDVNIVVEGHTDDVPLRGSGCLKDNWDLSVMRATSVVRILTQKGGIDPHRLTAAGRASYDPVDPAKTPEARRKNRRTEIILTPKLDKLLEILE